MRQINVVETGSHALHMRLGMHIIFDLLAPWFNETQKDNNGTNYDVVKNV